MGGDGTAGKTFKSTTKHSHSPLKVWNLEEIKKHIKGVHSNVYSSNNLQRIISEHKREHND